MNKLISILFLIVLGLAAGTATSEAGWKKRGWYVKKPGAECVMRKVISAGPYGKIVITKIRVCR